MNIIYIITDSISKLNYIGSKTNWKNDGTYFGSLACKSKKHKKYKLQQKWFHHFKKHPETFKLTPLEFHNKIDIDDLLEQEAVWQRKYDVLNNDNFVNASIANKGFKFDFYSLSEKEQNKLRQKHSIIMKKFWNNVDDKWKKIFSINTSKGIKNFYDNMSEEDKKRESLWKKKGKKNMSLQRRNEWISNIKKNRPHKNKKMYDFLYEKHGKERAEKFKKLKKEQLSGKNNPMYGNGYKVKGNKNGRALNIIIHFPSGEKYLCNGTFKKFCNEVLRNIKPQPHRKYQFEEEKDGWFFSKINNLSLINKNDYTIYK